MSKLMFAPLAAGALLIAAPAPAQLVGGGLVVVNVSNVANDLALDLDVDVQDVIDLQNVSVPIGIAANVCGVNANVLAHQRNAGDAACDATSTNQGLTQIVGRELNAQ